MVRIGREREVLFRATVSVGHRVDCPAAYLLFMRVHESGQPNSLHIFCDFDGTIASVDIGVDLFRHFGEAEPWVTEADAGRLGIAEYWRAVATTLREPLTLEALDRYLLSVAPDPGFASLVAFASAADIPISVVSDGLDLYVGRYLALHGAGGIEYRCNHAELDGAGRIVVSFPHEAEGCCRRFTIACKRNLVLAGAAPDERIVYIGDGLSDQCAAEHADIIFAKHSLAAFCNRQRLPHHPFRTLADVERQLRLLLSRRRIRPRHQAALLRKSAWEAE